VSAAGPLFRYTITRKLMTMVGASLAVIALLLALSLLSLRIAEGLRGYVSGENLWSKARHEASYFLGRYIQSGSSSDWQNFQSNIRVPLGDRTARLEMEKAAPDAQTIRDGFVQGGIPAEDVAAMTFLYRWLDWHPLIQEAISIWRQADEQIDRLLALADDSEKAWRKARPNTAAQQQLSARLHRINSDVAPLEREFSATLIRAGHALEGVLVTASIAVATLLAALLLTLHLRTAASLRGGIVGLRDATQAVARGDFAYRIRAHGHDELADLAAVFNDMIDRRQSAEAKLRVASEMQEKILRNSTNAIYALDRLGCFTLVNPRTCELSGYSEPELIGQNFGQYFPPEHAAALNQRYAALLRGEGPILNYECPFLRKDGSEMTVVFSTTALVNEGLVVGATGAAEDITERKRNAEKVQAHAAELARSNRELEQFAYVASHDLQEPLRSISSFAQLLGKRYKGQLGEEADEYIGFISDSIKRMKTLLEDLLAFSKVAGGAQQLQPVSLKELLRNAQANLKAAIDQSDAMITYDELPTLKVDAGQITQLLQNLLANAIKFRGKSTPLVHVGAQREGEFWHFEVRDNGIGIAKESAERIFVLFQRLHTLDQYTGNGIGLTICKKIVELHGGRIWAEPGAREGSVFHFTLQA